MVNFLTLPLFKDIVLPFLLVFALFFAILEKSRILGEDKHQINAIISFVVAALLVGFSNYVVMIQKFMIFLVICLIILFVLMMIYGFVAGTGKDDKGDVFKGLTYVKYTLGGIFAIALVIAVLVITDTWNTVVGFFSGDSLGTNIVIAIIVIVAILAAIFGSGKKEGSSSST